MVSLPDPWSVLPFHLCLQRQKGNGRRNGGKRISTVARVLAQIQLLDDARQRRSQLRPKVTSRTLTRGERCQQSTGSDRRVVEFLQDLLIDLMIQ